MVMVMVMVLMVIEPLLSDGDAACDGGWIPARLPPSDTPTLWSRDARPSARQQDQQPLGAILYSVDLPFDPTLHSDRCWPTARGSLVFSALRLHGRIG